MISLVGGGLFTPLGPDVATSCAAVHAGLSALEGTDWVDPAGDPMVLALALPLCLSGPERWRALAAPALCEAMSHVKDGERVGVWLALPSPRAGVPDTVRAALTSLIREHVPKDLIRLEVVCEGHASGWTGCVAAAQALRDGAIDVAIVGGIDSWIDPDALDELASRGKLASEACMDGFTPGEASAFCVLRQGPGLAELMSCSVARDPEPRDAPASVWAAEGLTRAFWDALAPLGRHGEADQVWSDHNGLHARATEWSYAYIRTGAHHADPLVHEHPADCWGDIGAATVPALLLVAMDASATGTSRGPTSLVFASSDAGLTGAGLLRCTSEHISTSKHPAATPLVQEHLEEAAFLLERRHTLLHDLPFAWWDLTDVETRFDRHLEGAQRGPLPSQPPDEDDPYLVAVTFLTSRPGAAALKHWLEQASPDARTALLEAYALRPADVPADLYADGGSDIFRAWSHRLRHRLHPQGPTSLKVQSLSPVWTAALTGQAADVQRLLAEREPAVVTPEVIDLLGWLGVDTSLDTLLRALADAEEHTAHIHQALHRITGHQLPEAQTSPEAWRAWLDNAPQAWDAHPRWRYGRPWSVEHVLDDLRCREAFAAERDIWLVELYLAGSVIPLDVEARVERQLSTLTEWTPPPKMS